MVSQSQAQLQPGAVFLDTYEIVEVLGSGAVGVVYKARHRLMERTVAIKMLSCAAGQQSEQLLRRFQQEAKAASSLSHPGIVAVHDFGLLPGGGAYTVMDYVEGTSLSQWLETRGAMPWEQALPLFIEVCAAMAHAHERGIVHRDLKPSNIMVVEEESGASAKVVDFGIAKLMPWAGKEILQLTQAGQLFGSPLYMSPEQCKNLAIDERTDIYSLGATFYECLCGQAPAAADTLVDVILRQISEPARPFQEVCPERKIPESLERTILRMLAKDPIGRFGSMQEVLAELEGAVPVRKTRRERQIKVLLADDSPSTVTAIAAVLEKHDDLEVVATAVDGEDAIDKLLQLQPHVIVMDLQMPRLSGLDAARQIKQRFPSVKVLALSGSADVEQVIASYASGMDGYCLKQNAQSVLPSAVRAMAFGGSWIDPSITAPFLRACAHAAEEIADETQELTAEIVSLKELDEGSFLCILAETFESEHKRFEAETLYKAAIALVEKTKGQEHRMLGTPLTKLADLYFQQGKTEHAEPLYLRALELRCRSAGSESLDVAALLERLASVSCEQNVLQAAEKFCLWSLMIREKLLGPDESLTSETCRRLASIYRAQGREHEAAILESRAARHRSASPEKTIG